MGRYMRKCKGSGEVAVMETAEPGPGRKRKILLGDQSELSTYSSVQQKTPRLTPRANSASPTSSGNSTCESVSTAGNSVLASCCSSSRSIELAKETSKPVDLEVQQENEAAVGFCATSGGDSVDFRDRREKTPSSEFQVETGELESTARPHETSLQRRCPTAEKMPTNAELEEFFATAEKNLHKQFIDKYNYDIAKDEPLEGRYEWVPVQLKP